MVKIVKTAYWLNYLQTPRAQDLVGRCRVIILSLSSFLFPYLLIPMFAGKSTTRNSTTTTTKQKHLDIGDIEHLLHDSLTNNEGVEADINENDLNDPELLVR